MYHVCQYENMDSNLNTVNCLLTGSFDLPVSVTKIKTNTSLIDNLNFYITLTSMVHPYNDVITVASLVSRHSSI